MSQSNKDLVADFLTALGQGDAEGLDRVFHPDAQAIATGTSAMSGARSKSEIVGTAGLLRQLIPEGIDFEIVSATAEDDRVACEVQGRSTLINGEPYNNTYVFVATIRDDRIVLLKEYFCTKLVEERLLPLFAGA